MWPHWIQRDGKTLPIVLFEMAFSQSNRKKKSTETSSCLFLWSHGNQLVRETVSNVSQGYIRSQSAHRGSKISTIIHV
jgi:hypothetical protein